MYVLHYLHTTIDVRVINGARVLNNTQHTAQYILVGTAAPPHVFDVTMYIPNTENNRNLVRRALVRRFGTAPFIYFHTGQQPPVADVE